MKKVFLLLVAMLMTLTLTGCGSDKLYYEGYNYLDLKKTLEAEEFEIENPDYKETDDQAIIYLFRGQGCGYCRKFLTFLNSISAEYGKYFKVVSFEVWNDAKNSELMSKMPLVTGKEANGVPYIIIGDKVFAGYSESYDDSIKQQIMKQYSDPSYDVFVELEKVENESNGFSNVVVVFFVFTFVLVGTIVCVVCSNSNRNKILEAISDLEEKIEKESHNKDQHKEEKKLNKHNKKED